jgi:hypothetical protein
VVDEDKEEEGQIKMTGYCWDQEQGRDDVQRAKDAMCAIHELRTGSVSADILLDDRGEMWVRNVNRHQEETSREVVIPHPLCQDSLLGVVPK